MFSLIISGYVKSIVFTGNGKFSVVLWSKFNIIVYFYYGKIFFIKFENVLFSEISWVRVNFVNMKNLLCIVYMGVMLLCLIK